MTEQVANRGVTLTASDVTFRYPGSKRQALDGVSLSLEPGVITAIVGPNGAGKSTLFRVLAGLVVPERGEVRVGERNVASLAPGERARAIGIAAQDPERPDAWTALEVVLMGRGPHLGRRQFESSADVEAAMEALERLDATALSDRGFGQLSGGEQQRVLLARALCQDTAVLLLDEPTSHLDPRQTVLVAQTCRALADEGRAICCVLHDLNLASQLSDRLVVIAEGRSVAEGAPAQVLTQPLLREVYGVEATPVLSQGGGPPLISFKGLSGR